LINKRKAWVVVSHNSSKIDETLLVNTTYGLIKDLSDSHFHINVPTSWLRFNYLPTITTSAPAPYDVRMVPMELFLSASSYFEARSAPAFVP